ncbi:MAG: flagellar motor protein MotD [Sterolibacterium sp.]|nr:flagellar motor protein MotD [Sterolibacterium sp.]
MPRHRRRHEEEAENHERWLVSYADFITLLFAFFVVMYAVSSVNEGKYRILSDSIVSAFRNVPGSSVGAQVEVTPAPPLVLPMIVPNRPLVSARAGSDARQKNKEKMRDMAKEIRDTLAPLVDSGQVRITENARGITLDINASILFSSGEARLANEALAPLVAVAHILAATDFSVTVEGHTDNMPIATTQFASNWELSGVRAASVVRLMIDNGVAASRLMAVGYADQRPVAGNDTADGRASNRRVAITIESNLPDQADAGAISAITKGNVVRP